MEDGGFLKPPPDLCDVNAMLGDFARADENDRNVHAIALFQNRIVRDIHFAKGRTELAQDRGNSVLGVLTKMAPRPRVESDLPRPGSRQPGVLRMFGHGLSLEYF
jgi:hypothetical protein